MECKRKILLNISLYKGLAGKYSIIYRGSGQDKATNAFSNYTGISFVGEWQIRIILD